MIALPGWIGPPRVPFPPWEAIAPRWPAATAPVGVVLLDMQADAWARVVRLLRAWPGPVSCTRDGNPVPLPAWAQICAEPTAWGLWVEVAPGVTVFGMPSLDPTFELSVPAGEISDAGRYAALVAFLCAIGDATGQFVRVAESGNWYEPLLEYDAGGSEVRAGAPPDEDAGG